MAAGLPCLIFPYEGKAAAWKFRDEGGTMERLTPSPQVEGDLVDILRALNVTSTHFDAAISLLFPTRRYLPLKRFRAIATR